MTSEVGTVSLRALNNRANRLFAGSCHPVTFRPETALSTKILKEGARHYTCNKSV